MYSFHGVRKVGQTLRRERQTLRLEHSLIELFDIYDRTGGPGPAVTAALDTRIDRCLTDVGQARPAVQERLYVLLRAKDIHAYLTAEEGLTAVKTRLLEHVLFYRTPEERWAAIRELLLAALEGICGVTGLGGTALLEAFKRQASLRGSPLGKLLQATALFNFDLDEELPPPNLRIRFAHGAFPGHCWEPWAGNGLSMGPDAAWGWSPANPLCRWEYLAADLGHALFRAGQPRARWEQGAAPPAAGAEGEIVYGAAVESAGEQMELFPLDPGTFAAELIREAHRAHGAEGVRLLILLLERFSWGHPGEVLEISLADLAAAPPGSAPAPRTIQERCRKLFALVERLGHVRLIRIAKEGTHSQAHASTLVTLLGEQTDLPQGSGARGVQGLARPRGDAGLPHALRLVVDPCFAGGTTGNLGLPYRDLPEMLLCTPTRAHPYAVGMFVHLRRAWQQGADGAGEVLTCSARQLLDDAGFVVREHGRYRAIEAMKRDLDFLQEQGLLGRWRLTRGETRDALDDVYRLESPRRTVAEENWPSSTPAGAQATA